METLQQWWRLRFSFKTATIVVCLLNLVALFVLIQGFISASSSRNSASNSDHLKYIKEFDDMRRAMEPLQLIKRVKEIEQEAHARPEPVQPRETKQTAAIALIERLNNFRSYSDSTSLKALEEWRSRKMERSRQRDLVKNLTATSQT